MSSHNPFEPHQPASLGDQDVTGDGDGLDDLKKSELEKLAEQAGLVKSGTKAELIERLREYRSA